MTERSFDIVVVGGGLAGIAAALSARAHGASVALVCDGPLCGGSSFSCNTWGLGMVTESNGPLKRGHRSLSKAMNDVGMGLCTPGLSERLTADGPAAIAWLQSLGARLRVPVDATQREYVPCFDDAVRTWHGFLASSSADALRTAVETAGVCLLEHCQLLKVLGDNRVRGVLTLHKMSEPLFFATSSLVMATGGLAGLYQSHICPRGHGIGHLCAMELGARMVNLEFQQLMVGYLAPLEGVVFNEKLWRWVGLRVLEKDGPSPLDPCISAAQEAHSWHGPFTAQRESRLVEQLICQHADGQVLTRIDPKMLGDGAPELVADYVRWLQEERGISAAQELAVRLFAHSSNGGVAIDENGWTGVRGLYAAGEAAGGVHGADRIGGLASVSALVFGRRAGAQAALQSQTSPTTPVFLDHAASGLVQGLRQATADLGDLERELRLLLDAHALVPRDAQGLSAARERIASLQELLCQRSKPVTSLDALGAQDGRFLAGWRRCQALLTMGDALLLSMAARTETRGAHWRSDYPTCDTRQDRQLLASLGDTGLTVQAARP